jgi:hypothetical protein
MLCIFTERDGRKGPPAGNKAECNRTNTPHSKATQRKAKPNQKPQTHTQGARQAQTTSAEGRARPRIGARPAARVATFAPDRHRDALPRQRATLSSRSAPEMNAARERSGPPACTAHVYIVQCAVSPGPRLRLFRPVSCPVCGFTFGWRAFSSVSLCKFILYIHTI